MIIYGTGFTASQFLKTFKVVGRGGRELHDQWAGDARAYLGMTTPGFPNLFMLYGPNTNIVVNGSIIFFSECSVRYILGCLKLMAETGADTLEVRKDVHDAFNAKVDAANAQMAWGVPQVDQLVQERQGPRLPELAVPAGGLLAGDPGAQPRRLPDRDQGGRAGGIGPPTRPLGSGEVPSRV